MNVNKGKRIMNKDERFELPPDEMAFRRIYRDLLESGKLTTVFRPGVRTGGEFRGYNRGDVVSARVIDQVGLDRAKVAPVFLTHPVKKIRIESCVSKRLDQLSREDFVGSSPDVHDRESLVYHLGLIYNLDVSSLVDEAMVTRIHFTYLE
jgi:hypothetical protein